MTQSHDEVKLLPCPFCRRAVTATAIQGANYSLVGCDNRDCAASDISCYPKRWNTRADVAETSFRDEAFRLLTECCDTINGLADQQAMPDGFYNKTLERVGRFLASHSRDTGADVATGESDCMERARKVIAAIAEGYSAEFKPDGSSFTAMKRQVCFNILRALAKEFNSHTVAKPTEEADKSGWVTFGRVKVDIENETETFERINPTARPSPSTPDTEDTNTQRVNRFRELKANWDSYGGKPIDRRAIEIALRLAPLLVDWQAVPRSDGNIQFERGNEEICIDVSPVNASPAPSALREAAREGETVMVWGKDADGYPIVEPHVVGPRAGAEPSASQIEGVIQGWRATLQDDSHVTDEDAEDLTLRLLAKRGTPPAEQQSNGERCVKCGHDGPRTDSGVCLVYVPKDADDNTCGCHCIFRSVGGGPMSDRDEHIAHRLIGMYADRNDMGRLRTEIASAIAKERADAWSKAKADSERNFRWAYQLLLALAKRRLAEANASRESENDWPAGQEWYEMVGSSHSIFLRGARKEAKIPEEAFMGLIRSLEYDVDDLYESAARSSITEGE